MGHWEYNFELLNKKTPAGNPQWRGWQPTKNMGLLPKLLALGGADNGLQIKEWRWSARYRRFTMIAGDGTKHVVRWRES